MAIYKRFFVFWICICTCLLAEEEGQWISRVIAFSSEYSDNGWSAQEIIGPPDVYPNYGDIRKAWAPKDIDANQFLEFEFLNRVHVSKIDIYETYNAGGVKAIKCYDVTNGWITLWSTSEVSVIEESRIFSTSFTSTAPCFSNRIRLDINCSLAGTWVEIDAVRLHGYKEEGQWISRVIAFSSQYSTSGWSAQEIIGLPNVFPNYGDKENAWAPKDIDANQFLEFEFLNRVHVSKIDIYETFNAGGVKAIKCYDVTDTWITLWSTSEVSVITKSRIFSPPFTSTAPCFSNRIRLDINCSLAGTWVQIDAVRLHGYKETETTSRSTSTSSVQPANTQTQFSSTTVSTTVETSYSKEGMQFSSTTVSTTVRTSETKEDMQDGVQQSKTSNRDFPAIGVGIGIPIGIILTIGGVVCIGLLRKRGVLHCGKITSTERPSDQRIEERQEQHYEDMIDRNEINESYCVLDRNVDSAEGTVSYVNTQNDLNGTDHSSNYYNTAS